LHQSQYQNPIKTMSNAKMSSSPITTHQMPHQPTYQNIYQNKPNINIKINVNATSTAPINNDPVGNNIPKPSTQNGYSSLISTNPGASGQNNIFKSTFVKAGPQNVQIGQNFHSTSTNISNQGTSTIPVYNYNNNNFGQIKPQQINQYQFQNFQNLKNSYPPTMLQNFSYQQQTTQTQIIQPSPINVSQNPAINLEPEIKKEALPAVIKVTLIDYLEKSAPMALPVPEKEKLEEIKFEDLYKFNHNYLSIFLSSKSNENKKATF